MRFHFKKGTLIFGGWILVTGVTTLVWLIALPGTSSFEIIDTIHESAVLAVSFLVLWFIIKIRSTLLSIGWAVFCYGNAIDLLDEFTKEPIFLTTYLDFICILVGLSLFVWGIILFYSKENELNERVLRNEEKYRLIFENSPVGIFHFNSDGVITECNNSFVKIIGSSYGKLIGLNILNLVDKKITAIVRETINGKPMVYEGEYYPVTSNKVIIVQGLLSPITSTDGKSVIGGIGIIEDITERKFMEEKLRQASEHDPLTGILNRLGFFKRVENILKLSKRYDKHFAVIYIDIDDFKMLNDIHGHTFGDNVLEKFCEKVNSVLRESDIFARHGGDEFVIALPETDEKGARAFADRIQEKFKLPVNIDKIELTINLSIGIAVYPHEGKSIDELIKISDKRMYQNKQNSSR
ncbi:hypothetical protein IX53_00790 [Kosmotoga pacifica]|uniref:Diguanylate cyclase n=2 Tax=Kosmotoga pacifica TaxID=1330330 RepID=A0A0G2ZCV8_9BACT|nr:hypothetical protein IX53_00790 [Kosmotoga pacifica]